MSTRTTTIAWHGLNITGAVGSYYPAVITADPYYSSPASGGEVTIVHVEIDDEDEFAPDGEWEGMTPADVVRENIEEIEQALFEAAIEEEADRYDCDRDYDLAFDK